MMIRPECYSSVLSYSLLYIAQCVSTGDCLHQKSTMRPATVTVTRGMARAMMVNRIIATTVCLHETI